MENCLSDKRTTIGKVYKVYKFTWKPYIVDDSNHIHYFNDVWNIYFDNHRKLKLKRLLNESNVTNHPNPVVVIDPMVN